jgi:phosphate:Na+ symporter
MPPIASDWQPPAGFQAGAQALAAWLDATKAPEAKPAPTVFMVLEEASQQLSGERKSGRVRILEDVALQRMPSATARAGLDTLVWADAALYHAWRLAESLRIASGQ